MLVWSVVFFLSIVFIITGVLSIGYFVMYACMVDLNNTFTYFWLVLGLAAIVGGGLLLWHYKMQKSLPVWVYRDGVVVLVLALFSFLLIEGFLIKDGKAKPSNDADYVIVLGARVNGEKVTANLARRLKAAAEYLEKNPDTKVILSGGQGKGEDISEAEAMKRYLCQQGIEQSRMILEDQSRNTDENLEFSQKKIENPDAKVVVVSNDFHIYRATRIAKRKGIKNVEGLGSPTVWYTAPNMYVREAFAVVKYTLFDQI